VRFFGFLTLDIFPKLLKNEKSGSGNNTDDRIWEISIGRNFHPVE
jgi:hypothetical protein